MTLTVIAEVLKCKNTHVLELVKYSKHMLVEYPFFYFRNHILCCFILVILFGSAASCSF